MKLLVANAEILKLLKDIGTKVVELFGSSHPQKAEKLLDASKTATDYNTMYVFLSIFLDPVSGHHEKLEENNQKFFNDIYDIIKEAHLLYCEIPEIDADDYTPDKISEYNTVISHHGYTMRMEENLDKNYALIKEMSKEEKAVVSFIHHCLLVSKLEEKLTEAHLLLFPVIAPKN